MEVTFERSLKEVISDNGYRSHELQHRVNKTNIAFQTKARIIQSKTLHDKKSEKNETMNINHLNNLLTTRNYSSESKLNTNNKTKN